MLSEADQQMLKVNIIVHYAQKLTDQISTRKMSYAAYMEEAYTVRPKPGYHEVHSVIKGKVELMGTYEFAEHLFVDELDNMQRDVKWQNFHKKTIQELAKEQKCQQSKTS